MTIRKFLGWILAALQERRAYNELRRLDDRMLRDIGLDRGRLGRY
jgi:uncharacterized protein YjiS (DUF1127 family)